MASSYHAREHHRLNTQTRSFPHFPRERQHPRASPVTHPRHSLPGIVCVIRSRTSSHIPQCEFRNSNHELINSQSQVHANLRISLLFHQRFLFSSLPILNQAWCALGCVNIPLKTSGKEGFAPNHLSALPSLPMIHVLSSQLPLVGLQLYLLNKPHEPKAPAPSGKETLGGTGSEVRACKNVLKGRKDIKGNHRIEVLIHSDTSLGEVSTGCCRLVWLE